MERFKINTAVLVCDGYMDCQCLIPGRAATVTGYAGEQVLVRDRGGHSEYVSLDQLQRLPDALQGRCA